LKIALSGTEPMMINNTHLRENTIQIPHTFARMSDKIAQLEAMLDERPDDPFIIYALAREYQQHPAGTMQALLMYEHLVNHHPAYMGTYYHYARLLYSIGNQPEAIRLIHLGIEQGNQSGDRHATFELQGLLMQWTAGMDDED